MKLYNSLSGRKEAFAPADPARPTMYVCGPTVYNYAHIGNGRAAVVFDLLFRLLRQRYGDVALRPQRHRHRGQDHRRRGRERRADRGDRRALHRRPITRTWAALGVLPPTVEPFATRAHPADDRDDRRADRRRPRLRGRGPRAVRRALVRGLWPAVAALARGDDRRRARRGRALQARSRRLRAVEALDARAARLGQPLGPRPARLAHRVLGDGRGAPRRHGRHPRRRPGPQVPAPRERARAERLRPRRRAARPLLAAQRLPRHRAREDVEVARATCCWCATCWPRRRARRSASRCSARTTASRSTGRRDGLARAKALARPAVPDAARPARAGRRRTPRAAPPEGVLAALEDDLNTPQAFAKLRALARQANASDDPARRRALKASCWPPAGCSGCCSRTPRAGCRRARRERARRPPRSSA